MTISLCMIVKNEAEQLPRCLESVKDYVDELIVLDTGSQDDTIAIAQRYGAKTDSIEWTDDFAAARNRSLELATGDWILVLDADETLTTGGQELLQQVRAGKDLKGHALESVLMITVLRHELNADQSPYSEISRLFRNRSDIRFNRPYHETVDDSVTAILAAEPHWQVVLWPDVTMTHTGYTASAIAERDKFNRAQQLMAGYLAQHPNDAYLCNKLGALYVSTGDWQTARTYLERGLAASEIDPSTAYELHYHLGLVYREEGLAAIAVDHYTKALAQDIPEILKVGARINLGSLWQARKRYREAAEQFQRAAAAAPDFAMAYFNLGIVQRQMGHLDAAIEAYKTAISIAPDYGVAYQNLGVALFKQGHVSESLQAFRRAIELYQKTNPPEAKRLLEAVKNLGIQPI